MKLFYYVFRASLSVLRTFSALCILHFFRSPRSLKLLLSYVLAAEWQNQVLSKHAAGDSVPILLSELLLSQVGADDRGFLAVKTRIEHVIKAGDRELIDYLCPEIVDY